MEYVCNYTYISEVLCINKDKKELACNGKCYLMTKLAKSQEEKEKQQSIPVEHSFSSLFFYQNTLDIHTKEWAAELKSSNILFKDCMYTFSFSQELLKPPIFLS